MSNDMEWQFHFDSTGTWHYEVGVNGTTINLGSMQGNSLDSADITLTATPTSLMLRTELDAPNNPTARLRTMVVESFIDVHRGVIKGSGKGVVKGQGKGAAAAAAAAPAAPPAPAPPAPAAEAAAAAAPATAAAPASGSGILRSSTAAESSERDRSRSPRD